MVNWGSEVCFSFCDQQSAKNIKVALNFASVFSIKVCKWFTKTGLVGEILGGARSSFKTQLA